MTKIAFGAVLLTALTSLTACGGDGTQAENGMPKVATTPVVTINVNGDTDQSMREFAFTDLEGVKQKCFSMGGVRGSVSCQPFDTQNAADQN